MKFSILRKSFTNILTWRKFQMSLESWFLLQHFPLIEGRTSRRLYYINLPVFQSFGFLLWNLTYQSPLLNVLFLLASRFFSFDYIYLNSLTHSYSEIRASEPQERLLFQLGGDLKGSDEYNEVILTFFYITFLTFLCYNKCEVSFKSNANVVPIGVPWELNCLESLV